MSNEVIEQADDLPKRLEFLGLAEEDASRLRHTGGVFATLADQFVEEFYAHLFAFEETARFLKDPTVVERLKRTQKDHFRSMFAARWNEAFVKERRQVGKAHADIGVEPQFFLGAYNQFLKFYLSNFWTVGKKVTQDDVEQMQTLLKGIFLDVGLSLDAYFRRSTEDVQRALDLLFEANRELKQFAHFTSHDLKTPLGTVANLCDEVIDEFGDEIPAEARSMIESARQTAYRMSGLIDDLLSLSIPREGEVAAEPLAINSILGEPIERLRPELNRKRIEVVLPKQNPRVVGRQAALREVFYNLLSNAVKFTEKEIGRILVDANVVNGRCIVSVADNGPGIPAEELQGIFAPFRRLSIHKNTEGSGLGLYFAKNLVEQEGGRIWVESRWGEGSCFFVSLKQAADEPSGAGSKR